METQSFKKKWFTKHTMWTLVSAFSKTKLKVSQKLDFISKKEQIKKDNKDTTAWKVFVVF